MSVPSLSGFVKNDKLQVREAEELAQGMIETHAAVFAKDAPLAEAREVKGLRAVFDEVGSRISYIS